MTTAAPGAGTRPGPVAVRTAGLGPSGVLPTQRVCLDCGSPLSGKFCFVCGQKDEPLKRGLKDLALEFVQHPLIDTKLWKSLVPLLLRPGALTEEYLAGRRTRYVRPLKLYLTISVLFFALFALRVPAEETFKVDTSDANEKALYEEAVRAPKKEYHLPIRWLDERLHRNTAALESPEGAAARSALSKRISGLIPKMVFFLLPLSAVLLKLFWWKRYFVEHLVFSLHLHTYAFASGLLLYLNWAPVTGVYFLWGSAYLVLAFRRVYRQGWVRTLGKLAGVGFAYALLLAAALLVFTFGAVLAA